MKRTELSENEIETSVLKAARGGGLPLGHAEDLAAASRYMDMEALRCCPCSGDHVAAMDVPFALDRVAVGQGPVRVVGDVSVIKAYVAAIEAAIGTSLIWETTKTGAVFHEFRGEAPSEHVTLGRRFLPDAVLEHLKEMAAKTLVPETDASRAAGAGAGLTDND